MKNTLTSKFAAAGLGLAMLGGVSTGTAQAAPADFLPAPELTTEHAHQVTRVVCRDHFHRGHYHRECHRENVPHRHYRHDHHRHDHRHHDHDGKKDVEKEIVKGIFGIIKQQMEQEHEKQLQKQQPAPAPVR